MSSEGPDMFGGAAAPLTFHDFLERMRKPAATDLVRSIKSFILAFMSRPPDAERDSKSVENFMRATEESFRNHPLWAGASEEELESAGEGLEKYLMTKLFGRAFAPLPEDADADRALHAKLALLAHFVLPRHLDIPAHFHNEPSLLLAQKELQKMGSYKAPRDKLVCVLNCCRVINNLLINVAMTSNGSAPGADDFLPVLIFVVLRANPPQLLSTVAYIQRYRAPHRLVSEASYFYTNLVSAVSFLRDLDASALSMPEAEFEAHMEAARAAASGGDAQPSSQPPVAALESDPGPPSPAATTPALSPSAHLATDHAAKRPAAGGEGPGTGPAPTASDPLAGAAQVDTAARADVAAGTTLPRGGGPLLGAAALSAVAHVRDMEAKGQLRQEYPFLYAQAGDLRVGDVDTLLGAYKELALKHAALAHSLRALTERLSGRLPARQPDEELGEPQYRRVALSGQPDGGPAAELNGSGGLGTHHSEGVGMGSLPAGALAAGGASVSINSRLNDAVDDDMESLFRGMAMAPEPREESGEGAALSSQHATADGPTAALAEGASTGALESLEPLLADSDPEEHRGTPAAGRGGGDGSSDGPLGSSPALENLVEMGIIFSGPEGQPLMEEEQK